MKSVDNMIYRLYEDVSPFYECSENNSAYCSREEEKLENLKLWRVQTQTNVSDKNLEWFVYKSSLEDFMAKKTEAVGIFGKDGYKLLCIAKDCEKFRNYINGSWYYPKKEDPMFEGIEKQVAVTKAYRGRYASRYALQTVRILTSLSQYKDVVDYWEKYGRTIQYDIVKGMAERNVARAYLKMGDTVSATIIYAKYGDIVSLEMCGMNNEQIWNLVYEKCPNSIFFKRKLQFLLTQIDNRYYEKKGRR